MKWLLHGPMTAAVADALKRHGHTSQNMVDLNLPPETDPVEVMKTARTMQLEILTTDSAMANAPFLTKYTLNQVMVYLQLEGGDVEQDDAVDRLFNRYKRLTAGRLYTITNSRVKVRQLPEKP